MNFSKLTKRDPFGKKSTQVPSSASLSPPLLLSTFGGTGVQGVRWSYVSNQATPAPLWVSLPSSVYTFPFDPPNCTPSRPQASISHNHRTLHFPEQFWQLRVEVSLTEGHWGDCLSGLTKPVYFANLIDSSIFSLRFLIFVS